MAVKDNQLVEVQNLTDHTVVYISYEGRRRAFESQRKMNIPAIELRQLVYSRGGLQLIKHFLRIGNKELAEELGVEDTEHEYKWTEKDVVDLLENGSLDRLRDALDYAPLGIIDLIVDKAVNMPVTDVNKRKIISEATGKNIETMIQRMEEAETATEEKKHTTQKKGRRVPDEEPAKKKGRRVEDENEDKAESKEEE